ncbi:hypothetical protein [Rathayibacter sp. VKM Ac-2760]|uniref:hypothetical protein n=1 Tax=Rathayibacter sp. VKM Ac-2760 TaxID=2609253 RepID=UPI00131942A4|nr:hypothetical protein [Rathayibacter sp. VKM Ac-2760]QHC60141.1 hypothetical protein GSU72_17440 [Rathayibacter sp. VKM Ac-2760]
MLEDLLAALHEPGAIHSAVAAAVCDACRTMLDVLPLAERLRGHVSDGRIMVVVETAAGQRQFDPRRLL